MKYTLVPYKELNVLCVNKVNVDAVLERYILSGSSTTYVIAEDESNHLVGIITLGDVIRCRKSSTNLINQQFTYINSVDSNTISAIYNSKKSVCQIPVISEGDNKLLGAVIFDERESNSQISDGFDSVLKSFYYQEQLEVVGKSLDEIGVKTFYCVYPDVEMVFNSIDLKYFKDKKNKYECGQIFKMTDKEQYDYFGDEYFYGIGSAFQKDYDKISAYYDNGIIKFNDLESHFFNIKDDKRVTPNKPKAPRQRLFIVGACFVFGAYVSDTRTIPYYLQDSINRDLGGIYEVINCGNMGVATLSSLFCEQMSAGDIVVVMAAHLELVLAINNSKKAQGRVYDLSRIFCDEGFQIGFLYNSITHHNYRVNQKISDFIYSIITKECLTEKIHYSQGNIPQNYYVNADAWLSFYKLSVRCGYKDKYKRMTNGAVVMNCNPFTNGHRFLIDEALKYVEHLYVFVVEEDLSFFSFDDRYNMVINGLKDLVANDVVTVIPSGRYIISKDTFAQYFEKEKEVKVVNSMEYDIRLFAEVVCKQLDICTRFVGQEPNDLVTREYNGTMKRILPLYGIKLIEFERIIGMNGDVVSASRVRKYLKYNEWDNIKTIVPQSTYEYLKHWRDIQVDANEESVC